MSASKKDGLVSQLVGDCKKLLQDDFREAKVKQSFIIVKEAKSRGLLGPDLGIGTVRLGLLAFTPAIFTNPRGRNC